MPLTIAVEQTANRKLGDASTTHASQSSCPKTCPFYRRGCYAESGLQAFVTRRLTNSTPNNVARNEAAGIATLSGTRPLRLHTVGDCTSDYTARVVADAAHRYRILHKQPVWTYTHSWRDVARASWRDVSVLASTENVDDARAAMEHGYAASMVVAEHPADGKASKNGDVTMIPCPQQTRGRTCSECRLCFDDAALLARRAVITFAAHGSGAKKVKTTLSERSAT